MEATIPQLQAAMTEGRTTSKALVQAYLARIEAYDQRGPRLNSIIYVNPNALKDAERLDAERARGRVRGPLHGIPIIVKDNYDTADMPTTASSIALAGFVPSKDGFQVRKLREAGAVIIAKSNMHELASGITTISSLGGQTRNPYDPDRNAGGSSGGTGAAIAASFAAIGMGSDTCGSIRIPAAHNNLVGLRPTKGLSSIDGVIPLSVTQDVAGPIARNITDLAIVLDATIGEDPADPATQLPAGQVRPKFMDALDANALRGARIGVLTPLFGTANEDQEVGRIVRAALEEMKKLGVEVIDVNVPDFEELLRNSSVIDLEFKEDLAAYLAKNPAAPVRSLGEILERGLHDIALRGSFERRNNSRGRDSDDYRNAMNKRKTIQDTMLEVMNSQNLDALVYPTLRRKAARIGEGQAGSTCTLSAVTGFPALGMPAGFTDDGLPVAIEFYGRPLSDTRLVAFAYSFEKSANHRVPPPFTPALSAKPLTFALTATGSNGSTATARFNFDRTTSHLSYSISISGVRPEDILYATLHQAEPGKNGPVVLRLSNRGVSQISGGHFLSIRDRRSLEAGNVYLNIGTKTHPNGELRVQLK
ncbi:MAG: CHRD domain-containing protein [Acidobacteria bacterium]|nr:CHRD domain-containing protein [Acidobacteriota bacterium]